MKKTDKPVILFLVGGSLYYLIEFIWKSFNGGNLHWSMFFIGGASFLIIGLFNEIISWNMGLIWQCLIGGGIITALEMIFGIVLNIYLKLNIWDYSSLPLNFMGQVCIPFSMIWCGLSCVGILLDDFIRYRFFGEEKPRYKVF